MKMIKKPKISPQFTVEDIHKIREYNYQMTKHLTFDERMALTRKRADKEIAAIEKIKKEKGAIK
jgi:hypothetical protein